MKAIYTMFFAVTFYSLVFAGANFTEAATPEECDILRRVAGDIPCNEDTPISDTDKALGINKRVAEAKDYLHSIAKNLPGTCAPPEDRKNIERLSNTFAVCAADFLRAYEGRYGKGSVILRSAFRDGAPGSSPNPKYSSANKCSGGATNSRHIKGIALDIHPGPGGSYETLRSFAQANPKFGVHFPWFFYKGKRDRAHMDFRGSCAVASEFKNDEPSSKKEPPPQAQRPPNPLGGFLRERQKKSQCEQLSQRCLSSNGQDCGAYYQQCQGGVPIPASGAGGNPSGNPTGGGAGAKTSGSGAQSAGGSQTKPQSVSKSIASDKNNSTNQNISSNQPTSTAQTVKIDQGASDTLTSVFGAVEIATTSEKAKEVEDVVALLEEIAGENKEQGSTTTTVRSIEVPLPELIDVATVFEQRNNIEIKNIDYLSDDIVSIEVQLHEPDGTSGVSGFFGPAGDTFAVPVEKESVMKRVCRGRPWDGTSITSTIVSPVFDSVCRMVGIEVSEDDLHFHGE